MTGTFISRAAGALAALVCVTAFAPGAPAAPSAVDHSPAAHIDDVYVFPVTDPTQVAIAMTIGAPLARGAAFVPFDPHVLYAIHIDNVGDGRDHLTFRFLADAPPAYGNAQRVAVYGPTVARANDDGEVASPAGLLGGVVYNRATILDKGVLLFAGLRRDPLFFDAAAFAGVRSGAASCFAAPGRATNAFVNDNILAIVFTAPKTLIAPRNRGRIGVWATASARTQDGATFVVADRAGRPHVSDLFGDDPAAFARSAPPRGAGRSADTAAALGRLFTPDVLQADIEAPNPAAYLGIEAPDTPPPTPMPTPMPTPPGTTPTPAGKPRPTAIPTPYRPFGGRSVSDPALQTNLRAMYGDFVAKAGLAPDDGHETPCLVDDGTTAPRNLTSRDFPYLDAPF